MKHSNEITSHPCPGCGEQLDRSMAFDGAKPNPGDITVCAYCACVSVYLDDLTTREVTPEKDPLFIISPEYEKVRIIQSAIKLFNRHRQSKNQ